ncbi:hypothetical protein GCM10009584_23450 [Ornithinimicrobium humiphilum]|uniref:Uncharacterized protein n=2 Tax=Ornithinimicrobium humiphilum TaxID=125288 RepID=A0A543KMQ6_9MICO|nr:hypothetical protein FB476_1228 [Ornithinimicrobium humiphilum]
MRIVPSPYLLSAPPGAHVENRTGRRGPVRRRRGRTGFSARAEGVCVMAALEKVTGAVCVVAGTAWAAACVVHNLQPQGCIGDGCAAGAPMRGGSPAGLALLALAGICLSAGIAGLVSLARRRLGPTRVALGAVLVSTTALLLLVAAAVMGLVSPDWSGMPLLVGPGVVLLVGGVALVAVNLWRARVVPRPLFVAVLATVALLLRANEQTSLILLAVPFGLALVAVGAHLVRQPGGVPDPVLVPASSHS